ncbi:cell division protein ZapA [Candidatus Sumerlaeota bacterium]|nr:cell division protein ZapA [Candidatus Sumerlaeota bacterium]
MAEQIVSHKVTIADQSFNIRIPAEDRDLYDQIAKFVQGVHKDIRDQGYVGGATQVWAMTAFQIAIELFDAKEDSEDAAGQEERIQRMLKRIEMAMGKK